MRIAGGNEGMLVAVDQPTEREAEVVLRYEPLVAPLDGDSLAIEVLQQGDRILARDASELFERSNVECLDGDEPFAVAVADGDVAGRAKEVLGDLQGIFSGACNDFEAELVEFDGEQDDLHLLVNYHPKVAVSVLVNSLKGVSSGMIRQKRYPSVRRKLWVEHYGHRATSPEVAAALPSP